MKDVYHYYKFKYNKQLNDLLLISIIAICIGGFFGAVNDVTGTIPGLFFNIFYYIIISIFMMWVIHLIVSTLIKIIKIVLEFVKNIKIAEKRMR